MYQPQSLSEETIAALAKGYADGTVPLAKGITVSTGLQAYDLEAPAKNLYPVLTPLRNLLPRLKGIGSAIHWKAVTAIAAGSGNEPSVAEGARNSEVSYTEADKSVAFTTWGYDDSVTWEAEIEGRGFEDIRARSTLSTLQLTMIGEEDLIVGGNTSLTVAAPGTITKSAAGSTGTLPTDTYYIQCVALPYFGFRNISGLTLPARHSAASGEVSQAITLGQILSVSVPVVTGAVAYAWFVSNGSGTEKLEKITYINSATFSAPLAGTGTAISGVSAASKNTTNFDGMLTQIFQNGYVASQATGTAGTGTALTADGSGGITEINTDFKYFWDNFRTSPDEILVNSQESLNVSNKVLSNAGGAGTYRVVLDKGDLGGVLAGATVTSIMNKVTNQPVKLTTHPTMPPGTLMYLTRSLPSWYKNANVPAAWVMRLVADYFEEVYARATRKWEHGVYAHGALQCYVPGIQGVRTNIANG